MNCILNIFSLYIKHYLKPSFLFKRMAAYVKFYGHMGKLKMMKLQATPNECWKLEWLGIPEHRFLNTLFYSRHEKVLEALTEKAEQEDSERFKALLNGLKAEQSIPLKASLAKRHMRQNGNWYETKCFDANLVQLLMWLSSIFHLLQNIADL